MASVSAVGASGKPSMRFYRKAEDAAARILLSADPDAFVHTLRARIPAFVWRDFQMTPISSRNRAYTVPLVVRREASDQGFEPSDAREDPRANGPGHGP